MRSPTSRAHLATALPVVLLTLLAVLLSGCSEAPLRPQSEGGGSDGGFASGGGGGSDPERTPRTGECYALTPEDVDASSSDRTPVDCAEDHTTETFAVGELPEKLGGDRDSAALGRWVFPRCQKAFQGFLAADESLAMRIQLSWAWFRPSDQAWDDGARWFRCDVVGGRADAKRYQLMPETARGLFRAEPPQEWLTCARGDTVAGSEKVPCSEDHTWRAVTTIKLGGPKDPYPGDREVQVRTRDFCSDSVVAWLNYPVEYEFGFTWFREAEWEAGNRRSVCWAKKT